MKICPKCQQQYPNGFQYCPNDTEALITNEEHIRRTKPLSAVQAPQKTEAHSASVEFVPITNPFPPEKTESLSSAKTTNMATEAIGQERQANPFRSGETARPAPETPRKPNGTFPAPAQTSPKPAAPQQPVSNGNVSSQPASPFSFSIPEEPGLISRLTAGLQNIGEIFKKSDYKASGDFKFLLQEESLSTRVAREFGNALEEFRRDPKRFVVELARGEGSNLQRRNALLAGSEMALVGYVTIYFISLIIASINKPNGILINVFFIGAATYLTACYAVRGFLLYRLINRATAKLATPKVILEVFNWAPLAAVMLLAVLLSNYGFYCRIFPGRCELPEEQILEETPDVTMLDPSKVEVKLPESAKAKEKMIGGSKSQPKPASGGGGGGRNEPTPPSKGVPPQMALTPQIIPPDPNPPKIKNPTLVVASTIYGDPKAMPPLKGPIGDPDGVPAPPSSGPGTGDGIGRGTGTGVGRGGGGGAGPGQGGNTGGGNMGIGGGGSVQPMTASLRPTILYRERAKYTEEARANKIQGAVVLQLTYTADGRITDIKVVRGLPDGLTESAIESAKKIRFQPAMKNGQPVAVRGNVEFNFTLY
ncbi:MAG TPA: TonB family protein [Blastocatellia bacterium]|jgi:TonB family protein